MLAAGLLLACQDGTEPLPSVARIEVSPRDTVLAPGDSVRFAATAFGKDDAPLTGVPLRFHLSEGSVGELSEQGLFRATGEGTAGIVVEEPRAARAFASVRISAVTGFSPAHSAFGGLVTVRGAGFGPASDVFFGGARGIVKEVASDGSSLVAWVPWDADVGPVEVLLDGVRTATAPGTFYLTGGGDDALEPNGLADATPVSFPFRNPFLLARADDLDHFAFEVTRPTPITVRLLDRGEDPSWSKRVVLQVNEGDEVEEFLGVAPAYAFGEDRPLAGVVSRSSIEPGRYTARVFLAGLEVIDRRYELRIDTVASFALPPDGWEPNDHPRESREVTLPFADTLTLENPWSVDYVSFRVLQRSHVELTVETFGPPVAVFLHDGERSVHWHLANGTRPPTWRGNIAPFTLQEVSCRVEAGVYHAAVLENSGSVGDYAVSVRATPSSTGFLNCLGTAAADRAPLPAEGAAASRR